MDTIMDGNNINDLIGKTIKHIVGGVEDSEELIFFTSDGYKYIMFNEENNTPNNIDVRIEDINGDLDDLINSPITMAEEVKNVDENPDDIERHDEYQDSFTWTFYKLATIKGYVTIRWYGESNGFYSEDVEIRKEPIK